MNDTHTEPSREEIEACAFCIWEHEGKPEGRELEHWLQAEKQLAATHLHEEPPDGEQKAKIRKRAN